MFLCILLLFYFYISFVIFCSFLKCFLVYCFLFGEIFGRRDKNLMVEYFTASCNISEGSDLVHFFSQQQGVFVDALKWPSRLSAQFALLWLTTPIVLPFVSYWEPLKHRFDYSILTFYLILIKQLINSQQKVTNLILFILNLLYDFRK